MQVVSSIKSFIVARFFLTAVVPLAVLGAVSLYFFNAKTTESLEIKNQLLAASLAGKLDESLREPRSGLRQLSDVLRDYFQGDIDGFGLLLESSVRNSGYFKAIYLLDRNGVVRSVGLDEEIGVLRDRDLRINLSGAAFFRETRQAGGMIWTDLFLSPVTGRRSVGMILPLGDNALVADIDLDYLRQVVGWDGARQGLELRLFDRQGNLILAPAGEVAGEGERLADLQPVIEGLAGHIATYRYHWQGADLLGSVARIPDPGWLILLSQQVDEAYSAVNAALWSYLLALLGVLAFSYLGALRLAGVIVRPLRKLTDQAGAIAAGSYGAVLPVQAHGELEELAASFRDMACAVQLREAQLTESHEHYQRLFNGSQDLVFVYGIDDRGEPELFSDANVVACTLLGYRREELLARGPRQVDLLFNDASHRLVEVLAELQRHGRVLYETELQTRGGEQLPVEISAQLLIGEGIQVLAIARDISERRRNELALRDSEREHRLLSRQFQTLFDGIPDALMLLNGDLRVNWANQGALDIFGVDRQELLGSCCHMVLHGSQEVCPNCAVRRCFASGEVEAARLTGPDQKILDVRAFPIKDEAGDVVRVIELARDVTQQIKLEREALRTGQLATLGELAAGVAHEINNPINGVINYAQILLNQAQRSGGATDIPARIIKEGDRIARIVGSLLSFARKRRDDIQPVMVSEVFAEALTLMRAQMIKDGIRIVYDLPGELPPVAGSPQQIEQVIINLLSNARNALNGRFPGGDERKVLSIGASLLPDEMVQITIRDQGIGIPEAIREKILTPFFTTSALGEGTGLGLSICQTIVSDHAGQLEFQSVEGEYTLVMLRLPSFPVKVMARAGNLP